MSTHLQWRKRKNGMVAYVVEYLTIDGKRTTRCLRRATDADLSSEGVVAMPVATESGVCCNASRTPDIGALIAEISAKHKAKREEPAKPAERPKPLWLVRQEIQTERARRAAEGNGYWGD